MLRARSSIAMALVLHFAGEPVFAGNTDAPEEVAAADKAEAPTVTPAQVARALAFMKDSKPERRKGAYAAFRKLGDATRETYAETLEKARAYHDDRMGTQAFDLVFAENSVTQFRKVYREWVEAREGAIKFVQTDWKAADPGHYKEKHAEMDAAFARAEAGYARMIGAAAKAGKSELALLESSSVALIEIEAELDWCEGREPRERTLRSLLAGNDVAEDLVEILRDIDAARKLVGDLAACEEHNASSSWASAPVKSFASLINPRRVALGLPALRLDQNLSKACAGHCEEMARLGYFAHESPVEENKSFGNRAKNAGFAGFASGECIYVGGAAAIGAHKAWWYSDGHRLIMYAKGPNTLGLGTNGNHWTLNTGSRKWE